MMTTDQKSCQSDMARRLKSYSAKIDDLKAKALHAGPHEKLKYYEQLEELVIRERGAKAELAVLLDSEAGSWERQRAVTETALRALDKSLQAMQVT